MEEKARKQWNLDFQQCWSHIVAVKCLLCPPGDADWSLGPGWTSEWTNERATERTIRGATRSDQETTPPDVGTDQNLWPEHTLTPPLRGPEAQGAAAAESGAGVRGQGAERWIFFFFFFFSSPETTKRQRTDCTDWQRAVQKVRRVQSDTPQRGKLITHIHEWTEITGDKQGVCFFWTLGKLLRSKGREESQKCSPGDAGVHVRFTRRPQIMWWIRLTGECFSLFLRKNPVVSAVCVRVSARGVLIWIYSFISVFIF